MTKSLADIIRERAAQTPVAPAPAPMSVVEGLAGAFEMLEDATTSPWERRHNGVQDSEDFQRIKALPRRPAYIEGNDPLVAEMTERLKRPGGTMTLRPIQAFALAEAERAGGLFGMLGVGAGKTLLTLLLSTLWNAERTLLLVPPSLLPKLIANYEQLLPHWRIQRLQGSDLVASDQTGVIFPISYAALQTKSGQDLFDRINPTCIIGDEAHALAGVARSTRRTRYRNGVKALRRKNRLKHVALMSGTFFNRDIMPVAPLARSILGNNSPFPFDYQELSQWSWSLNPSDSPSPPGILQEFCEKKETPRQGFRRRLVETPGVVATSEDIVDAGLELHQRHIETPPEVLAALEKLRKDWTTPTGHVFSLALEMSRYARQLASGIELHWTFPRGEHEDLRAQWFEVRKAFAKEIRDYLTHHSRPGMDSQALLEEAAASGKWQSQFYEPWREIEDQVQPLTQVNWVSDFMVRDAVAWGNEAPGIIWCANPDLGEAIAEMGGFPWFGGGAGKAVVKECARKKARTIVATMAPGGHAEGNDMQLWSRMLVTYTSSNPKRHQQLLARAHRHGQLADKVDVYFYLHTPELRKAMATARALAEGVYELTHDPQRLLDATYTF